jgi:hypothetical protein
MSKCRRIKFYILIFLIAGLLQACTFYKSVYFQALKPSHVKIGINNTVVNIHCEYCDKSNLILRLDSVNRYKAKASLNFLYTLKEKLQQSPLLQNAKFSLLSHDSLLQEIKDTRARQENGLVILLDSIYLSDTLLSQKPKSSNEKIVTYGVIHRFRCKTFQRRNMEILDNYLLEDTLFFPVSYFYTDVIVTPEWDDAVWDTGIKAGEKYAHYLAPYWVEQKRQFYYQNKYFRKAFKFIQTDQLDSAMFSINECVKQMKNIKDRSKAFHNLALIYELKDDFPNALALSDSAYKTRKSKLSEQYSEILRLRKIDKIALDWQMEE